MNVKELKQYLNELPDEMPVGILDLTTDDTYAANYPVNKKIMHIGDYVDFEADENEVKGQMLFLTFENSLNENPI